MGYPPAENLLAVLVSGKEENLLETGWIFKRICRALYP